MKTERQETHRQHDQDRFHQCLQEFVDGFGDDLRLVRDPFQIDPDRQLGLDLGRDLFHILAELDNVATLLHRDAESDHFLAVETHLGLRRILVFAFDDSKIAQPESRVIGPQLQVFEILGRRQRAAHADLQIIGGRRQHAGRLQGILRAQLVDDVLYGNPQLREFLLRKFDEYFFILDAEQIHLGNRRQGQQLLAHEIGVILDVGVVETIARDRKNRAVGFAEFIIEERTQHALRQGQLDVVDLLAHLIPCIDGFLGRGRFLQLQDDQRFARFGITADGIDVRRFLQLLFQLVRHLVGHLQGGGAGPLSRHHHRAEGKRRILILPQAAITENAADHQHYHQVACQRYMFQRPARQIETGLFAIAHRAAPPAGVETDASFDANG